MKTITYGKHSISISDEEYKELEQQAREECGEGYTVEDVLHPIIMDLLRKQLDEGGAV